MRTTASELEVDSLHVERTTVDRGKFEIWHWSSGHYALHAGRAFAPGELVRRFSPLGRVPGPTRHSVQIGENEHILLDPAFLQYMNHSCAPNVAVDIETMAVVAIRPIVSGTELRFFYPSTEWLMTQPFRCHCHEAGCLGLIRGAAFLSTPIPSGIQLAQHIQSLLCNKDAATAAALTTTA